MGRPKTIETDELLRIAREVFLESGAFGSTREIARRAGISEAALFKRFSTKAGLFAEAMAPPVPDVEEILARARAEKDPRRSLQALVRSVLAYYRTCMPRILHLITHPAVGIGALHPRLGHDEPVPLDVAIAEFLRDQYALGRMHAPNPRAAAALLVATLHAVALFEVMGVHGGAVPESHVASMIDAVWSGLAQKKSAKKQRSKR